LRKKIENNADRNTIEEYTMILQTHVITLIDNNVPGVPVSAHRMGRPIKSLRERLGTKEGRMRNNLMGKRVDFCARSVITPDPNISIEELGVPEKIAMNLTKPIIVTERNIAELYRYVQNGPDKWPGAKTIYRKRDGLTLSLGIVKRDEIILELGDIVHRHIIDGDAVLFNRQPSLHKPSMMVHLVRVMPYSTFRLNVFVCKPYNADFDGDEMNMHLSQSIEAE